MNDFPGGSIDLTDVNAVRDITLDPGYPTRWTLDMDTGAVTSEALSDVPMELPTIDPRQTTRAHRFGYATARLSDGPPVYTGLARIDFERRTVSTQDLAPDLPGEPMFLPIGSNDTDGVIATVVYRAADKVSELQLRDLERLDVIARLRLPHHQPPGFHGDFVPARG